MRIAPTAIRGPEVVQRYGPRALILIATSLH